MSQRTLEAAKHTSKRTRPRHNLITIVPLQLGVTILQDEAFSQLIIIQYKIEIFLPNLVKLLDLVVEVASAKIIQACQTNLSHSFM